jgi:hypothetical protein
MLLARSIAGLDMKEPDVKPKIGHNWNWPRKTWLQKRLDMLKARDREINQKPANSDQNPPANAESTHEKQGKEG